MAELPFRGRRKQTTTKTTPKTTWVPRVALIAVLSVLILVLLLCPSSFSRRQSNNVDVTDSSEEYEDVSEGEQDSYEDSQEYVEERSYDDLLTSQIFEALGVTEDSAEFPPWSPENDPNYEGALAKLLQDRGPLLDSEKLDIPPDSGSQKPSYMFSIVDMKKLVRNEVKFYHAIKTYLAHLDKRSERLRRWVEDYEGSTVKAASQMEKEGKVDPLTKLVTNPFVSHRMVRRFSKDLPAIMKLVRPYAEQRFLMEADRASRGMEYPDDDEDYKDSMESLIRIQHYNNYTTKDVTNGKLGHLETNVRLGFTHAYDLAVHSEFQKKHKIRTLGIEWMEMALKLFDDEGIKDDDLKTHMSNLLAEMVQSHDETWETNRDYHTEWYFDAKIGSDFGSHLPQRPRYSRELNAIQHRSESVYSVHTRSNFRTLCSGRNLQTEEEKSQLRCWYEHKVHPYWTVNPIKIEALSANPVLYQMYDLLSPKSVQYLIDTATPQLKRSLVINVNDPKKNDKSDVRTSSQTWLYDDYDPNSMLTLIGKRIEYASGLYVVDDEASESLQVASYGGSHHYDEHMDALVDERRINKTGDRIATFMFYLNDVEVGGKTAFPVLGTAASPVAGSAVMWYNLKKNGEPDYRLWHGGCPVVYGVKWVANKWILSYKNWNRRPCSRNSSE